ncbi:MAG: aspartyl/asparaginyl beta-hydroxylase domain-containing protein [Gammaproteobacteria bacterium]|nr:lipid A hydroxylase LpxO [Gammaproteobacteria bacterium]
MYSSLPLVKISVLLSFVVSTIYVHFRGRVRHSIVRQLTDHSTIMAPFNALMYLFSAVPTRQPYIDVNRFPELAVLQQNWETIRDEALRLFDEGYIRAASTYNDLGFNSFFRRGWKRFYLKWYGEFLPSARSLCPKTTALLEQLEIVNAAMFTLLPPGSRLGKHRDPFAGSLRYHLGLSTPNSERCAIVVDGEAYYWRDGEAVMFDETFIHYAYNETDKPRLILFCDIDRPLRNPIGRFINRYIGKPLARAAATQNLPGEKVGILNKLFGYVYQIRILGKKIRQRSEVAYQLAKWGLVAGILAAIFLT